MMRQVQLRGQVQIKKHQNNDKIRLPRHRCAQNKQFKTTRPVSGDVTSQQLRPSALIDVESRVFGPAKSPLYVFLPFSSVKCDSAGWTGQTQN